MEEHPTSFHIAIHARPAGLSAGAPVVLRDATLRTLDVPEELRFTPWHISFESACERLNHLPRMFVEPDGALVWVSTDDVHPRWQLDGNLWDRESRLLELELKGHCTARAWEDLLDALQCDPLRLMIRLVRHGVFVEDAEFRRWAFG
jgi:hypothetical protein